MNFAVTSKAAARSFLKHQHFMFFIFFINFLALPGATLQTPPQQDFVVFHHIAKKK